MDINFEASDTKKEHINEGLITRSIKQYINRTNFPKKLLLKKIELYIDKRKDYVTSKGKLLIELREQNKKMISQMEEVKRRNSEKLYSLKETIS